MFGKKKTMAVAAVLVLTVIAGIALLPQEDAADDRYTIQVVTNPDFAPYEYMWSDTYEGIDMDIWRAVAKALDCNVNFNVMDFDSIINAIDAGKYDVGASGFTVTEERKQQINFTNTYSVAHQVVLVLKDGPLSTVTNWEDLKGRQVGVESGTTGYYLAVEDFGDANVLPYNTYTDVIQSVVSGYAGFAVLDNLVAESFAEKYSNLKILDVSLPGDEVEEYAFVISKSNVQMLQHANKALDYLTGTGVISDIFGYYGSIGYDPDKPGYFTAHPENLDKIDFMTHYKPTDKHTIEVATNPDFPPYDYLVSNSYEGIDMDIWKAIAYTLDCNVNFNFMEFDSIINAIQSNRFEVGASGFTVTDERKELVNFSNTYAVAHQNVLVMKNSPLAAAKSWEDLKGAKVAVESGTTGYYLAADLFGDASTFPYNTYTEVIQSVLTGYAGFAVLDDLVAESYVEANSNLTIVDLELPGAEAEQYAFVFNKGNTELLGYTNKAMQYLYGKGVIDDIYKYYGEIGYDPSKPGYYSAHPEKLQDLEVLVHYIPGQMRETLEVVTNPDFPPYDYLVSTDFEGIDMDIWKAIAHTLDCDVNFNFMEFDSIINAIQAKQYNVGASGFTVTDERKEMINFSDTYAVAYQNVLILKDSPLAKATTWEDLKGTKIAVESGTTGYYLAADVYGDANVSPFNTYTEVVQSVLTKHVGFAILDDLVAVSYVEAHPDELTILKVELPGAEAEEYAFVLNKQDTRLLEYVNRAMAFLKSEGIIDDIFDYYGSISYDPEKPGYFSAHPEELEKIQVIDHYISSEGGGNGGGQNWFEWLWSEIIKNFVEKDRYQLILMGLENTVYITVIGLAIGLLIGILCAIVRAFHDLRGKYKILNAIAKVYITVIRGTPILVQLLIIYFVVFASSGLNSILIAGIAFGINSGAYVAEIVRAGINAVPKGQLEAAESLGMTFNMAMLSVILPQAFRNILPALCNEGISLLKETSIAGYIGIIDVTKAAMLIRAQTYSAFVPLIGVALIYLVIVLILQYLVGRLERRLNNAYR